MNETVIKIEGNLYGLYTKVAVSGGLEYRKEDHYSWVCNRTGSWPNYIFNIDLNKLTREDFIIGLANRIRSKEVPPVIVNREPQDAEKYYELAESQGLRQIYSWTGMALERKNFSRKRTGETALEIISPAVTDQFNDWMETINSALFSSKSLSLNMVETLNNIHGLKLYLGYKSGVAVCTALSFQQEKVAGLYMISTLPGYRGKGYGTKITGYAIEDCFKSGAGAIILHSSGMGEGIYRSFGFLEYCKFGILWMVGNDYV